MGKAAKHLTSLATWTSARVGKQDYELGQVDCFRLVMDYAKSFNDKELPVEFDGMTLETYGDWYSQDETRTVEIAIKYLDTYLHEVTPAKSIAGDVLVLRYGSCIFFGIDGGNGKIITVFIEKGIRVISKRHFKIIKAFTWAFR